VTVRRIAIDYKMGLSPEAIAQEIPHLSLAQVYSALAYYHANKDLIETDIAVQEAEAERLEAEYMAGKLQLRGILRLKNSISAEEMIDQQVFLGIYVRDEF